jgi:hypothetical protein
MPKFMIPKTFQVDGFVLVSVQPETPQIGEISFHVGTELHSYQLGRRQLDQLARDIAAKLKAAPPPARHRSSESSQSSSGK